MTMTKLKVGVIGSIVVAGAVTSLVVQHESQGKIREVDTARQQQAGQLAQLQSERERLSNLLAQANRSVADVRLSDLLRLRGEALMLRQQTNDLATLQEENRRLQAQNSQQANQVKTPLQLKEENYARSLYARDWLLAFRVYAMENQEQFPTNFEQAASYLPDAVAKAATNITTDQFEIVYHGSYELTNGNNVIVLREKQARRQWPHGNWSKVYGFADGHSEIHGEADGNFDDWEKQRTISPAPTKQ